MTRARGQAIFVTSKNATDHRDSPPSRASIRSVYPRLQSVAKTRGSTAQSPDRVEVMLIEGPRRAGISHPHGMPGLTSDPRSWGSTQSCVTVYRRTNLGCEECSRRWKSLYFCDTGRHFARGRSDVSYSGILERGLGVSGRRSGPGPTFSGPASGSAEIAPADVPGTQSG